ncbi:hypothetical protein TTHT_0263 [Thermotomaculum hydrothermale]|uniref:Uncharacterized protein n=1 Tax=Thermotomaculum hydrothermale TaxID=981385 RepID=A0A7R6PSM7_9BACT|nr:hypothetical protein [Thermotomaculum hydrothermale]BBB31887.1 hypothetical protein TTHT_0263 [Thermotomaculum hydrothermale]
MKNALIIINEKGDTSLSKFPLLKELPLEAVRKLSFIFMDEALSEGFPVEKGYSIFLVNFSEKDKNDLSLRYNNFVKQLIVEGKTYPELIKNTVKQIGEYDSYLFVRSNIIPYTETQFNNFFERLETHDMVFGAFDEDEFFILGFNNEIKNIVQSLKEFTEESLETIAVSENLDIYYLPEKAVVTSLESLTELRQKLNNDSGLARKIDNLILEITRYHEDNLE